MKAETKNTAKKLTKLDYAVLSALANIEMTGYDITKRLKHFWSTSHSRIYPVLAKLEEMELVKFRLVNQKNKPSKKIYCITDLGKRHVDEWVSNITKPVKTKNERMLKFLSLDLSNHELLKKILDEFMEEILKEYNTIKKMVEKIESDHGVHSEKVINLKMLSKSNLAYSKLNTLWCLWSWYFVNTDVAFDKRICFDEFVAKNWAEVDENSMLKKIKEVFEA